MIILKKSPPETYLPQGMHILEDLLVSDKKESGRKDEDSVSVIGRYEGVVVCCKEDASEGH